MKKNETCSSCGDKSCSGQERRPGEREEDFLNRQAMESRMCRIKHKILVLSGKGGVGKSTVAVNLATALALEGKRVGLLDVDIHGPSVPKLLHLEGRDLATRDNSIIPVEVEMNEGRLCVMSIGFLLRERDDAVIWRGPRKFGVIMQFLRDVEWGELDYLVVDSPPGTGDEPLAVAQLLEDADGAVVVTTPQEVAVQDVRRCVVFCRQVNLPVLGVIENMSGFTCPKCGEYTSIFGADGGRTMADEMGVIYLGAIPIEPEVVASADGGTPMVQAHPDSETAKAFGGIVGTLLESDRLETEKAKAKVKSDQAEGEKEKVAVKEKGAVAGKADKDGEVAEDGKDARPVKIAVPMTGGVLSSHFGHCERFVLFHISEDGKTVSRSEELTPPPHEPGTFPKWLHEQGATVIIAGGMGSRAQNLFGQNEIQVVVGAGNEEFAAIVQNFLEDQLETGSNLYDH